MLFNIYFSDDLSLSLFFFLYKFIFLFCIWGSASNIFSLFDFVLFFLFTNDVVDDEDDENVEEEEGEGILREDFISTKGPSPFF